MGQLEDMHVYVRIVEAGGIGKAADQLGIAKSAVSRRLNELEKRLNAKLLQRSTRAITLTPLGKQYYERALYLLDDVDELNRLATEDSLHLKGRIRLAAPQSFGVAHLSAALDEFLTAYPDINLDIDFSDRHIDLVQEGIDLAIRIGDLSDSTLIARRITPIRLLICASPSYLDKFGIPTHPDDLKTHQLLAYQGSGRHTWKLFSPEGKAFTIQPQSKLIANSGDFLRELAISGHGIISSPSFICWEALLDGRLVSLFPNYHCRKINAYAVYPQTRYLSQRARVMIEFLVKRFGDLPYWDRALLENTLPRDG